MCRQDGESFMGGELDSLTFDVMCECEAIATMYWQRDQCIGWSIGLIGDVVVFLFYACYGFC